MQIHTIEKENVENFLTSLVYEARDCGEVRILEGLESELQRTKNIEQFLKTNRLKKQFKEFITG
jgi:hypothetical protein